MRQHEKCRINSFKELDKVVEKVLDRKERSKYWTDTKFDYNKNPYGVQKNNKDGQI